MADRRDPVTPAEKEAFRRTARPANTAAGAVYPNREHRNADRAARRHAHVALHELEGMALRLRQKLDTGSSEFEGSDADRLAEQAGKARTAFAEIAILRDVREWHAADLAAQGEAVERFGKAEGIVRTLAEMSTDSTNPTSTIIGLVEAARELVPEEERQS
jgi:hypothetical protein